MKHFYLFLLFALLITVPTVSHAQDFGFVQNGNKNGQKNKDVPKVLNPYDDKYKPDITALKSDKPNVMPNYIYYMGLIRKDGASPDDVNLFLMSPFSVSGCINIEQPNIETKVRGNTMMLKITDSAVSLDNEVVRYFHYDCAVKTGLVTANITLSKKQLIKDGIKTLSVSNDEIAKFTEVKLEFKDNVILAEAEPLDLSRFGLSVPIHRSSFEFWTYPDNTYILFSSELDVDQEDAPALLRSLALRRGLTPLDEQLKGFKPHETMANTLYVVDTHCQYKDRIRTQNDVTPVGTIISPETQYGVNGKYIAEKKIQIFAKKPGIYE